MLSLARPHAATGSENVTTHEITRRRVVGEGYIFLVYSCSKNELRSRREAGLRITRIALSKTRDLRRHRYTISSVLIQSGMRIWPFIYGPKANFACAINFTVQEHCLEG